MFLRCTPRKKNGKEHCYWSIVENKRCASGKIVQRHVLYLGEINDHQPAAWQKSIDIFEVGQSKPRTVALFADDRVVALADTEMVRIKLSELQLRHPRQWGACRLACQLYDELQLDGFWAERLKPSRKGTRWDLVLETLCAYRLIDPGSEWRLHRQWFESSALADLLGADFAPLAKSKDRVNKERAMRRRQLKGLWKRLHELQEMELSREAWLMKLGAARQQAPRAWRLGKIKLPKDDTKLEFSLRKKKLRQGRGREARYLLRSNRSGRPEAELWEFYRQLAQVEEAFKHLKSDLVLRPFHHQKEARIEAHIFVAFLAYCLQVTLTRRLKDLAPGRTARSVLEKLAGMQMIDVHLPTTDGREVILTRYTQPEPEQRLLLEKLKLQLPEQPPPKITSQQLATQ